MTLAPLFKSNAVLLFQTEHGNDTSEERIKKKMPRRVKKRRKVQTDDGVGDIVSFQFAFFSLALEQAVHFEWREKRTARNRALSRDFSQNGRACSRANFHTHLCCSAPSGLHKFIGRLN